MADRITPRLLLGSLLSASLILAACAGTGVRPPASTSTMTVEPASNQVSTTSADTPPSSTSTTATVPGSTTTTMDGTTTIAPATSTTTTSSTTTTLSPSATVPLPASAGMERVTWSGTFELSAVQGDGSVGTTSGFVTGSYVAPDRHRTEYFEDSRLTAADGTVVGERSLEWVVGAVNDRAWFERDDVVEEMPLDEALRFVPYLSSATGAVVPSDGVLADLAGRNPTTVDVIGRQGRRFELPDADVARYAPLFLHYTPALYGSNETGSSASVELVIDVATGALLRGSLHLEGWTAAGGEFDLDVSIEASAVDERWIQVLIPG